MVGASLLAAESSSGFFANSAKQSRNFDRSNYNTGHFPTIAAQPDLKPTVRIGSPGPGIHTNPLRHWSWESVRFRLSNGMNARTIPD
jgi:hypothetical protein